MEFIEVAEKLSDIYSQDYSQRYEIIAARFKQIYGEWPELFVRAPGRVNLIGEHVDYNGYPVFPMAVEYDTVIAIRRTDQDIIKVSSITGTKYPPHDLSFNPSMLPEHSWINYFVAGYNAGISGFVDRRGFNALVEGNLPQAAGLSSSASFTVASAVATIAANTTGKISWKEHLPENSPISQDIMRDYYIISNRVTKSELAGLATHYERLVGTACGGMDQAISLLAERSKAALIEFNPLQAFPVSLPENVSFVIANSLTPSAKVLTLGTRFNKRVCECRLAVKLIALQENLPSTLNTLKEVQEALQLPLREMSEVVERNLTQDEYTTSDLEQKLGNLSELLGGIPYSDLVLSSNTSYFLKQ